MLVGVIEIAYERVLFAADPFHYAAFFQKVYNPSRDGLYIIIVNVLGIMVQDIIAERLGTDILTFSVTRIDIKLNVFINILIIYRGTDTYVPDEPLAKILPRHSGCDQISIICLRIMFSMSVMLFLVLIFI